MFLFHPSVDFLWDLDSGKVYIVILAVPSELPLELCFYAIDYSTWEN